MAALFRFVNYYNLPRYIIYIYIFTYAYKVGPPSYKMVYTPHEYYSYRYHKP